MSKTLIAGLGVAFCVCIYACKKESKNPSATYNLTAVNIAGISGTVTFTQASSTAK